MSPIVATILGLALGLIAGKLFSVWRKKERFFAACEYWIYLPAQVLPDQNDVFEAMVAKNPYGQKIGKREGLLFSDIRLHISLILKAKNPHVFRPDLFTDAEADRESLAALAKAQSIAKIRYLSEEPLSDNRHLLFVPHLADAYARLGQAVLVYDAVTESMMSPAQFSAFLRENDNLEETDAHVRVNWVNSGEQAFASTKGMIKKGLPELNTAPVRSDNQLLVLAVLGAVAGSFWREGKLNSGVKVECFGDEFEATLTPGTGTPRLVHLKRIQTH
ncbi:MAG: hypothetical protein ABL949_10120 [Fimbriimonadaceae bacterium]